MPDKATPETHETARAALLQASADAARKVSEISTDKSADAAMVAAAAALLRSASVAFDDAITPPKQGL